MANLRARRPSYASVMATIAVLLSLGGTSYAAVKLGKNAVKARNIAPNAVTSAKVKDGSLQARDFKAGVLPGAVVVRHGSNVQGATVTTTPTLAVEIGQFGAYSGAYSSPLVVPAVGKSYLGVAVQAHAVFSSVIGGATCSLQSIMNGTITTVLARAAVPIAAPMEAYLNASFPAFRPGDSYAFALTCTAVTSATMTSADMAVTAGLV